LADHARQDAAAWRERADRADRLLTDLRTPSEPLKVQPWWRFGKAKR
jgi:hypothetical protein